MIAIFYEEDGEMQMSGYAVEGYRSNDAQEVVESTSEEELNSLIPDGVEGDWKENSNYFYLEGDEIVFDEERSQDKEK